MNVVHHVLPLVPQVHVHVTYNITFHTCTLHYVEPCRQGWVYDECASGCPPTCSDPSPGICLLVCKPGCRCEDGLVLDENTGDCVDPGYCTGMAQFIIKMFKDS